MQINLTLFNGYLFGLPFVGKDSEETASRSSIPFTGCWLPNDGCSNGTFMKPNLRATKGWHINLYILPLPSS